LNRRNFIHVTGASLASLAFLNWNSPTAAQLIQLPEKVSVLLDDGMHDLVSTTKESWTYQDISVQLKYHHDSLQVFVYSPSKAISNVALHWKISTPPGSKLTGDHWERTYGDVFFDEASFTKKLPWYFIQQHGNNTNCFGVKTGCSTMCYWQVGDDKMKLTLDTRSGGTGVSLSQRMLHAADIVATKNNSNENTFVTARRFCDLMCSTPRLPKKPVYGINDWYVTYGKNSADIILAHTALMTDYMSNAANRPFSVIDSGWAAYSPLLPGDCCWQDDYTRANDNFKDMSTLATKINKLGMRPGLWTRPLCASHKDPTHVLLPDLPNRKDPKKPVLDPTIEENLARVKNIIETHKQWGYELVKHDFTTHDILGKWGFEMDDDITTPQWRFYDNSRTTAEVILQLYKTIREGAGDMYLIGCNTISHLSAGIFELNRIGDDVSGREWDRTAKMGPNTLGFRMVQHKKFYSCDGDCVGLTTKIPWEKNKQWMALLAESGTPLFVSAQKEAIGAEQKTALKRSFDLASKELPVAEPLDWLINARPAKWRLNGKIRTFDWS